MLWLCAIQIYYLLTYLLTYLEPKHLPHQSYHIYCMHSALTWHACHRCGPAVYVSSQSPSPLLWQHLQQQWATIPTVSVTFEDWWWHAWLTTELNVSLYLSEQSASQSLTSTPRSHGYFYVYKWQTLPHTSVKTQTWLTIDQWFQQSYCWWWVVWVQLKLHSQHSHQHHLHLHHHHHPHHP